MDNYSPDSQRIPFDGLLNARELGGMPLTDGKYFKKGIAIRSDSPSELSIEQATAVRDFGVTQVIDLRSEAEVATYGNVFKNFEGVTFHNVPLFLGNPDAKDDPTMNFLRTHKLGDFYLMIMEELGERVGDILRLISNNNGITLFHCAHGKDRTGVISALLYLIAGASKENIIKNYAISYEYMRPILDPLIAKREDALKHTLRSDAENMEIFLGYIEKEFDGSVEKLLIKYGLTEQEIIELKNKLR